MLHAENWMVWNSFVPIGLPFLDYKTIAINIDNYIKALSKVSENCKSSDAMDTFFFVSRALVL
jgi:hypothetical protein